MSSSPISSQRTELPRDPFDPSPISLLRHSPGLLIQLAGTSTVSEVVSTNSVEKLNQLVCVLKNIVHYVFGFYSSYCAFICFLPFKSIYHSFHMLLSGSFIFNFLPFSLHSPLIHSNWQIQRSRCLYQSRLCIETEDNIVLSQIYRWY